ncbi:hypothetical protein [Streptomyces sp. NPDC018352]|uniref:hypothetical protein n=1 Tax=Streptomyces sp. NPDC018352 TaxID=3157194 RepID=UPI0033EFAC81
MSAHDPHHHARDPSQSPDRRKEDVRPARSEEREVAEKFGEQWTAYAAGTPAFRPKRSRRAPPARKQGTPGTPRTACGSASRATRR